MSAWRREAIARLPELRDSFQSAESPMALWVELRLDFDHAMAQGDHDLARRILEYAAWCISEKAGKLPSAASTAAVCAFYEHLPEKRDYWPYFPEWFTPEEFRALFPHFGYFLSDEEAEELRAFYWKAHKQHRGRRNGSRAMGEGGATPLPSSSPSRTGPAGLQRRRTRRWSKVPPPPMRSEVAARLLDLVEGRASRDEVEDWALQWVAADDGGVEDECVWQALILLSGAALMDSPESYLHCEADFRQWLQEFRQCTSENEDGQSDERSKDPGI